MKRELQLMARRVEMLREDNLTLRQELIRAYIEIGRLKVADEVDMTDARASAQLQADLAVRKPEGPIATGECHWCGTELLAPKRWCDSECRNAWEKFQRRT